MTKEEVVKKVDERRGEVLEKTPYFHVVGDRLLCVIPKTREEKTNSGIIIPQAVQQNPHYGWILSAGDGETVKNRNYKRGMYVMWGKYSGTFFDWGDAQLRMIEAKDVWGFMDDPVIIASFERIISAPEAGIPSVR